MEKTYNKHRPTINDNTLDDHLIYTFSKMLDPFQDNHINVIIPSKKQNKLIKPSTGENEFSSRSLKIFFGI